MKMIFWNCRGARNQNFKDSMNDRINDYHPDLVILLETKVCLRLMGSYFHQFELLKAAYSDPIGRSGGI